MPSPVPHTSASWGKCEELVFSIKYHCWFPLLAVFFFLEGIFLCFGYLKVIQVSCLTGRKQIVEVTLFLGGGEMMGFLLLWICTICSKLFPLPSRYICKTADHGQDGWSASVCAGRNSCYNTPFVGRWHMAVGIGAASHPGPGNSYCCCFDCLFVSCVGKEAIWPLDNWEAE